MMTPSAVNQETARMRTRQQIREADAYRASSPRSTGRRPWTPVIAAFRARRVATGTVPEASGSLAATGC